VKITVDTAQFHQAHLLVQEWQRRARAVRGQFLYRAVNQVHDDILGHLPPDRKELRDSLRVQTIRGLPDSANGYLIRSIPKGRGVAKAEGETTVVYVSARDHLMMAVPEETTILQDYSPWTLDTMPYAPDPKTSEVVSRRVSRREVVRVRRLRRRDRPEWSRRMVRAGIRTVGPTVGSLAAVPDTAFESLRLEFGLGGSGSHSHWRRAILKLALRGGAGMIARKREFTRAMTDLRFSAWERWPRRTPTFATIAEARKYVPFQKRLGLQVGQR